MPNMTFTNTIIKAEVSTPGYLYEHSSYTPPTFNICCIHNFTSATNGFGASITSDPLLIDPINGNLKLQPSSPCIGTGTII
jgi:hypothetical protein